LYFFFSSRRRHTRFSRDWSSDVCSSDLFYTEAGLRRAGEHLAPGGILAVWSYAPHAPFAEALRRVFREVRVEPVTVFNDLVHEEIGRASCRERVLNSVVDGSFNENDRQT